MQNASIHCVWNTLRRFVLCVYTKWPTGSICKLIWNKWCVSEQNVCHIKGISFCPLLQRGSVFDSILQQIGLRVITPAARFAKLCISPSVRPLLSSIFALDKYLKQPHLKKLKLKRCFKMSFLSFLKQQTARVFPNEYGVSQEKPLPFLMQLMTLSTSYQRHFQSLWFLSCRLFAPSSSSSSSEHVFRPRQCHYKLFNTSPLPPGWRPNKKRSNHSVLFTFLLPQLVTSQPLPAAVCGVTCSAALRRDGVVSVHLADSLLRSPEQNQGPGCSASRMSSQTDLHWLKHHQGGFIRLSRYNNRALTEREKEKFVLVMLGNFGKDDLSLDKGRLMTEPLGYLKYTFRCPGVTQCSSCLAEGPFSISGSYETFMISVWSHWSNKRKKWMTRVLALGPRWPGAQTQFMSLKIFPLSVWSDTTVAFCSHVDGLCWRLRNRRMLTSQPV